mmetsp:Transcript_812/g.3276  ORF Transcript_812/g.3276 Transcript_812/m.3276 type:complete len:426 (-) Transcript_812:358-1635(-)
MHAVLQHLLLLPQIAHRLLQKGALAMVQILNLRRRRLGKLAQGLLVTPHCLQLFCEPAAWMSHPSLHGLFKRGLVALQSLQGLNKALICLCTARHLLSHEVVHLRRTLRKNLGLGILLMLQGLHILDKSRLQLFTRSLCISQSILHLRVLSLDVRTDNFSVPQGLQLLCEVSRQLRARFLSFLNDEILRLGGTLLNDLGNFLMLVLQVSHFLCKPGRQLFVQRLPCTKEIMHVRKLCLKDPKLIVLHGPQLLGKPRFHLRMRSLLVLQFRFHGRLKFFKVNLTACKGLPFCQGLQFFAEHGLHLRVLLLLLPPNKILHLCHASFGRLARKFLRVLHSLHFLGKPRLQLFKRSLCISQCILHLCVLCFDTRPDNFLRQGLQPLCEVGRQLRARFLSFLNETLQLGGTLLNDLGTFLLLVLKAPQFL